MQIPSQSQTQPDEGALETVAADAEPVGTVGTVGTETVVRQTKPFAP